MIHAQGNKTTLAIVPVSKTDGATASGNIDCLGFDYCSIDIIMATAAAPTDTLVVLKLSESDDTVVTNFADVSGFVGGTDFTIPVLLGSGSQMMRFNVDTRKRKRFLKLTMVAETTGIIGATANLSRGSEWPNTASEAGVSLVVNG